MRARGVDQPTELTDPSHRGDELIVGESARLHRRDDICRAIDKGREGHGEYSNARNPAGLGNASRISVRTSSRKGCGGKRREISASFTTRVHAEGAAAAQREGFA